MQKTPTEPPPAGFTEVHIIGTKYIDYFTDGSTTIAVPGDPNIDGNLDKPLAPIPTHAGMTWVHTTGQNLYDTPSGDLEAEDYAVQADGSYIQNAPQFVSSTSTPAIDTSAAPPKTPSSPATSTPSAASITTPATEPNAPAPSLTAPSDTSTSSTTISLPAGSTSGASTTNGSTAPDSRASTTIATTTSA